MSLSNTTENATLKAHLQGTDPSYRAGATQYLALFTGDPGESASLAAEADYTGYSRVALTKATAWTDGGSSFTNAAHRNDNHNDLRGAYALRHRQHDRHDRCCYRTDYGLHCGSGMECDIFVVQRRRDDG